jgi:hypothetical protein
MGRNHKAGVFQRFHQETAHVVVVFGEENLGHGGHVLKNFRFGGSMDVLSLTDGKFRVKFASLRRRTTYVVNNHRNGRPINQCKGIAAVKRRSSSLQNFFPWQNGCDYRQCPAINARFSGGKAVACAAKRIRIEGTTPAHDPV